MVEHPKIKFHMNATHDSRIFTSEEMDRQTDMVKVMGKILQHTSATHKEVGFKKILSQIRLYFLVQIYNLVFSFRFADQTKFN